jgi:hypothetical protein
MAGDRGNRRLNPLLAVLVLAGLVGAATFATTLASAPAFDDRSFCSGPSSGQLPPECRSGSDLDGARIRSAAVASVVLFMGVLVAGALFVAGRPSDTGEAT